MDNILDGMRETINLSKTAEWEGQQVLNMSAEISSDPNSQMNYMVSVLNNDLYTQNLDYFRKEVQEFKQVVQERENYLFEFYYPEKIEEGGVVDNPEEPVPGDESISGDEEAPGDEPVSGDEPVPEE